MVAIDRSQTDRQPNYRHSFLIQHSLDASTGIEQKTKGMSRPYFNVDFQTIYSRRQDHALYLVGLGRRSTLWALKTDKIHTKVIKTYFEISTPAAVFSRFCLLWLFINDQHFLSYKGVKNLLSISSAFSMYLYASRKMGENKYQWWTLCWISYSGIRYFVIKELLSHCLLNK